MTVKVLLKISGETFSIWNAKNRDKVVVRGDVLRRKNVES